MNTWRTQIQLIAVMFLLGWCGTVDLISLLSQIEPGGIRVVAQFLGGSETLAVVLIALFVLTGTLCLLLGAQSFWNRHFGPPEGQAVADGPAILASLSARFPTIAFTKYRLRRAPLSGAAIVTHRSITVNADSALLESLRAGPNADQGHYFAACLILLHEVTHASTGDLFVRRQREALCLILAGLSTAVILSRSITFVSPAASPGLVISFTLVITGLTAVVFLGGLRQVAREVEKTVDLLAIKTLSQNCGTAATQTALHRLADSPPSRASSVASQLLEEHPQFYSRLSTWAGKRRWGGLIALWIAALLSLTLFQSDRIDPVCNDCNRWVQVYYNVIALLIMAILTSVVYRVSRIDVLGGVRSRSRALAVLTLVTAAFVVGRFLAHGEYLKTYIRTFGVGAGIPRFVFLSVDPYTWFVTFHLAVAALILMLLGRPLDVDAFSSVGVTASPRWDRRRREGLKKVLAVLCQSVFLIGRAYDSGLGCGLFAALVLYVTNVATVVGTEQKLSSSVVILLLAIMFIVAAARPRALFIVVEGFGLWALTSLLVFVVIAAQAFAVQHHLDIANANAQIVLGGLLRNRPSVFAPYWPSALIDSASSIVLAAGVVACLTWMRVIGAKYQQELEAHA